MYMCTLVYQCTGGNIRVCTTVCNMMCAHCCRCPVCQASSEVWLVQSVAGIQPHPAANGFDHVLIKPGPPRQLTHVRTHNSVHILCLPMSWLSSDVPLASFQIDSVSIM